MGAWTVLQERYTFTPFCRLCRTIIVITFSQCQQKLNKKKAAKAKERQPDGGGG